jgi:hypothetical protein
VTPQSIDLGNGLDLSVTFVDAVDWDITPFVQLGIPTNISTPLPAAMPLCAAGLGALGFFGWRRKRKAVAVG